MNQFEKMDMWISKLEDTCFAAIAEGLVPDLDPSEIVHVLNFKLTMEDRTSKPSLRIVEKGEQ